MRGSVEHDRRHTAGQRAERLGQHTSDGPPPRLLGQTAAWQLAHRVVTSWAEELEVDVMAEGSVAGSLIADVPLLRSALLVRDLKVRQRSDLPDV